MKIDDAMSAIQDEWLVSFLFFLILLLLF